MPTDSKTSGQLLPNQKCAQQILEDIPTVMRVLRSIAQDNTGGLSVPQLRTLALLSQGLGVSVSDVAAHLDVTTPTASALVERLVRKDYVQRRHDPAERRRVILTATQKGREVFEASRTHAQNLVANLLSSDPPESLSKISEGLTLLAKAAKLYNSNSSSNSGSNLDRSPSKSSESP